MACACVCKCVCHHLSQKFTRHARDQPAISAEMQVHNGSTVTLHDRNVITVAVRVPQDYKVAKTTQTKSLITTIPFHLLQLQFTPLQLFSTK